VLIDVLDTEWRFLRFNRQSELLSGYSEQEVLGRHYEFLVPPSERSPVAENLMSLSAEHMVNQENHWLTKDGDLRLIRWSSIGVRDAEGQMAQIVAVGVDITEQRQAEEEIRALNAELEQRVAARTEQLARVNRELETFAYSVSHDLRAPLRAVSGFSQALLEDYADQLGEDGRHDLERVDAAALRMGRLIDAVLELSRLSRRRLVRGPVDLTAMASEIVAELRSAEPDRRVEVEIQDRLLADADHDLVRIVLVNLLANAMKFTASTEAARIRFGMVNQDAVPVYFVADNGAGFDMAHAKRLFLPFHRLHRDDEFPGEGIGLATVMRAVRKHDGEIWAEGAVNHGATFSFTLTAGARVPASAATGEDVIPLWQPAESEHHDGH
jgi:PAS domain S-box-containing protein